MQLAIADRDTRREELRPIMERMALETSGEFPSTSSAIRLVTRTILAEIAYDETLPREGLRQLVHEVYYPHLQQLDQPGGTVGESYGLQNLIALWYGYEDLVEQPNVVGFDGKFGEEAFAALGEEVKAHARDWLAKNPDL